MASTVEITSAPAQAPLGNSTISGPQINTRGGVRNRNRGSDRRRNPDQQEHHVLTQQERASGGQQSRRGNKPKKDFGRRGQLESQSSNLSNLPAPPLDPPPGPGGGGTFGSRLTKDAINTEGEVLTEDQDNTRDEEDEEMEVCFICASPVVHNSVGPCNHRTCHICALRLRALYKTRACAHCRVSPFQF